MHLEVKRCEALRIYPAMAQAVADSGDQIPLVLHRKSRQDWLAVVRLDDLPELVARLYLLLASD